MIITTASLIKGSYFIHSPLYEIDCYLNFIKFQDKGEGNIQALFFVCFEPGSHYIARLAWNSVYRAGYLELSGTACVCLPSAGSKGVLWYPVVTVCLHPMASFSLIEIQF